MDGWWRWTNEVPSQPTPTVRSAELALQSKAWAESRPPAREMTREEMEKPVTQEQIQVLAESVWRHEFQFQSIIRHVADIDTRLAPQNASTNPVKAFREKVQGRVEDLEREKRLKARLAQQQDQHGLHDEHRARCEELEESLRSIMTQQQDRHGLLEDLQQKLNNLSQKQEELSQNFEERHAAITAEMQRRHERHEQQERRLEELWKIVDEKHAVAQAELRKAIESQRDLPRAMSQHSSAEVEAEGDFQRVQTAAEARCLIVEARLDELSTELKTLAASKNEESLTKNIARDEFRTTAAPQTQDFCQKSETLERFTSNHLDSEINEEFAIEESMWEVCLLMGFDCLGADVSVMLAVGSLLNAGVQLLFCMVVYGNLADENIDSSTVEAVKHWRGLVGHAMENVNQVSRTTLVAQLCGQDGSLPLAAAQFALQNDVAEFLSPSKQEVAQLNMLWLNGSLLCRVALMLWLISIAQDLLRNFAFIVAMSSMPRGHPRISRSEDSFNIERVGKRQIAAVCLLSCGPRFFTALMLGWMGVRFLAYTTSVSELLLNAMALAFVLDIDEMMYSFLVPARAKLLMSHLAPIPSKGTLDALTCGHARCLPGWRGGQIATMLKFAAVVAVLILVDQIFMQPLWKDMREVKRWMCDGDKDFAFTINKASGVVYYYKSQPFNADDYGTYYSKASVLNLTGIENENISAKAYHTHGESGLTGTALMAPSWQQLVEIHNSDTSVSASLISCSDTLSIDKTEPVARMILRETTGNYSLELCSDIPPHFCLQYAHFSVRALCPITCGCNNPWHGLFYGTSKYGCPGECGWQFQMQLRSSSDAMRPYQQYCKDSIPGILIHEPSWLQYVATALPVIISKGLDSVLYLELPGQNYTDAVVVASLGCMLPTYMLRKGLDMCTPDVGSVSRSVRPWCPGLCGCKLGSMDECPHMCGCSMGECPTLRTPQGCTLDMCSLPEDQSHAHVERNESSQSSGKGSTSASGKKL